MAVAPRETAQVWEALTGKPLKNLTHQGAITSLVFSPKGSYLAVSTAMRRTKIWNSATFDPVAEMEEPGRTTAMGFSPDEQLLITASIVSKIVRVWKVKDGDDVASLIHGGGVSTLCFSQ